MFCDTTDSASKAGLRAFLMAVRRQLENAEGGNSVKIVEILPPAVDTALFDVRVFLSF